MSDIPSRRTLSREGFEILFFSALAGVGTGWLGFIGLGTAPLPSVLLLVLSGLFLASSVITIRPDYWNRYGVPLLLVAFGMVTVLLGALVLSELGSAPLALLTLIGGFALVAYWARRYMKGPRF